MSRMQVQPPPNSPALVHSRTIDVSTLSATFPNIILAPKSEEYKTSNAGCFTLFESEIEPACIARSRTVEELSSFIRQVVSIPDGDAANIEGGITIGLAHFKGVEIDEESKKVAIGVYEKWGNMYGKLVSRGMPYFSRKTDFVCDNVVNFSVVLASGEVVQANAQTNPSLFQALKGSSNNFGIVTHITLPIFSRDIL
ncbi:FAD-binding domain-containing protein [Lindgomyces ingoldianus]|uniref:FAD-binding domain-containing protein n=1 Tax=Lindgomyces ingoldianus TaxID=673940 RepID=A0ACB6QV82_9PLEO|nr:FAD-binding domain-containing protein [Lindgomyces ingoldianus]KAF2470805.1 FAD-binding domain-containing protein [Lindgomyces ingoldianus]